MTIQDKPILHGRDHLPGHPDPIPGLLTGPSGTVSEAIIATVPGAYYKLDETAGDWADSSPGGRDATYVSRTGTVRGVASGLDEDDGSLCVTAAGGSPGAAHAATYVGSTAASSFFVFNGTASFSVTARVYTTNPYPATIQGSGICGTSTSTDDNGWGLYLEGGSSGVSPLHALAFHRSNSGVLHSSIGLPMNAWTRITATYDGTTMRLYFDDTAVGSTADGSALHTSNVFFIGTCGLGPSVGWMPWNGEIDSVAVWDRALTPSEVGGIAEFETSVGGAGAGWVMTTDGAGGTTWAAPTLEVEF